MATCVLLLTFLATALSAQEIRAKVLPTVDRTGEVQFEAVATTVTDTRRAAAEARLAEALEQLREERRNNGYEIAREYYLTADEFIDPQGIWEAAGENDAQAAEFEITRGQRLLSQREWSRGIASQRLVATPSYSLPPNRSRAVWTKGTTIVSWTLNPSSPP